MQRQKRFTIAQSEVDGRNAVACHRTNGLTQRVDRSERHVAESRRDGRKNGLHILCPTWDKESDVVAGRDGTEKAGSARKKKRWAEEGAAAGR